MPFFKKITKPLSLTHHCQHLSRLVASSAFQFFALFGLWAFTLTYPLPLHLFSHIPLGDEKVGTVPFFNLWTLQWNIDQLMQGYPNYWDAPIFRPASGTFAFSEPQPLSALLAAPLWLGFQSPALGYNGLIILFLILNGWFAYALLRSWGVAQLPAFLAGLLTQSLPFVAQEMGVLQLAAIFGFLWILFFLSRILNSATEKLTWRNSFGLALGAPVTFLTCSYYGLFTLLFLPVAFLFQLQKKHLQLKTLGQLLTIGLLALGLSGPFLMAQNQRLTAYGFRRSAQTIENNSAQLKYYANFLDYNLLYGRILNLRSGQGQRLFPGFGLIILAGLGFFGSLQKRIKAYLGLAVFLALILSLGLRLDIGGVLPYQWIRENIPGFSQLRSPFRFAVFVQLHLALLAGFGLHNLSRWFWPQPNRILIPVIGLALFEVLALPLPLQSLPPFQTEAPWQSWLNEKNDSPRIILLPFAQSSQVADFEQTTRWMLMNRHFQGTMVNGYSGFFPPDHARLRTGMTQFSIGEIFILLREKQVDYVVVFYDLAEISQIEIIKKYLPLVYHDESNKVDIYALKRQN